MDLILQERGGLSSKPYIEEQRYEDPQHLEVSMVILIARSVKVCSGDHVGTCR